MCLPSELHVVVSVGLYLQLFVGGFMSYLRYLCLFAYNGVQHILCCVFVLLSLMLPVSLACSFLIAPSVFLTFCYHGSVTLVQRSISTKVR